MNRCLIILPGSYPPGDAKAMRMSLLAAGLGLAGIETRILALGMGGADYAVHRDDYGTIFARTGNIKESVKHNAAKIAVAAHGIFSTWPFDYLLLYGPFWRIVEDVCQWAQDLGIKVYADCTEWYAWRPWRMFNNSYLDHLAFRKGLSRLSGAIAISDYWAHHLHVRGISCVRIPAPLDTDAYRDILQDTGSQCRRDGFNLAYFGALSARNLAMTLLRVVHRASASGLDIRLHCYGHHALGASSPFLQHRKRLRLEQSVLLHGRLQTRRDVLGTMRSADALILLRGTDSASRGSFPTRLPEMLLSGRPVITSATADVRRDLINGDNAYLVPAGCRVSSVVDVLKEIVADPDRAATIGVRGQHLAIQCYDYIVHGARLANFLRNIR